MTLVRDMVVPFRVFRADTRGSKYQSTDMSWYLLGVKKIIWTAPTKQNARTLYLLRTIYMVRLCCMRQAYDRPTTQIVSCKSILQLAYDCRVCHKKCHRILKHV